MRWRKVMAIMKGGRMMVKRKGKVIPMQEDLALFDGMRVMTDGTVMMTDGNARSMMDGEAITMDGKITEMETSHEPSR